jgi:hypothetical protein
MMVPALLGSNVLLLTLEWVGEDLLWLSEVEKKKTEEVERCSGRGRRVM